LQENSNFTFGAGFYGDLFNSVTGNTLIGSVTPPDAFNNGFMLRPGSYTVEFKTQGGGGNDVGSAASDDVAGFVTIAIRHDQSDATAKMRAWLNGAESTGDRATASPSATGKLGDTGRPLYIGGSWTGTGNTADHFEFAFLADALSDADMATITANPADVIEVAAATITVTPDPTTAVVGGTRTETITRTIAAGAGGVSYNVTSSNPAVASVTTPQVMAEAATTKTFDITGVSVGSATITVTNAADSGETDSITINVSAPTTTTLKLLAHIDALGATAVKGTVFEPGTGGNLLGDEIGKFTGEAFETVAESGQAPLLIPVTAFGGGALTVSDTPVCVWEATSAAGSALGAGVTIGSVGPHECTVVEV
jgi:hypothetical protein